MKLNLKLIKICDTGDLTDQFKTHATLPIVQGIDRNPNVLFGPIGCYFFGPFNKTVRPGAEVFL
jgi:hypothetical protein